MKIIRIKIKGGNVTVKAEGYKGDTCKDATKLIEGALGKVSTDQTTGEMYEEERHEYISEGQ